MQRGSSKAEVVEYRGHRYRRYPESKHKHHRRYFYGTEPRRGFLHRHMWEDAFGPIPDGYDVHHRDENTLNNVLDNFECITKKEHRARHPMSEESMARQLVHLKRIQGRAAEWHRSPAGRAWHRAHAKRTLKPKPRVVERDWFEEPEESVSWKVA